MSNVISGKNIKYGKSGVGYIVLKVCLLGPVAGIWLLMSVVLADAIDSLGAVMFVLGSFFLFFLLFNGVKGLGLVRDTVYKFDIVNGTIRFSTFGGEKLNLLPEQYIARVDTTGVLNKRYAYITFPEGEDHILITVHGKLYYASSETQNIEALKEALFTEKKQPVEPVTESQPISYDFK